jgi:hypothetical protein
MADGQADVVGGGAQALVVAGLAGHIREQVPQPVTNKSQPVAFRAGAEQHLGHGQADQFGVRQLGWVAWSPAWAQQLVDGDVQCDDEVVEVGAHKTPKVDIAVATPILGDLALLLTTQQSRPDTESSI